MEEKKQLFETQKEGGNLGNLPGKFRLNWVEESFDFENANGRQIAAPKTQSFLGASINSKKIKIFFGIMLAILIVITGRLFWIQILNGDSYRVLAEGNRIRLRPIQSERGIIYDASGRELVINVPSFVLSITEKDLPREENAKNAVLNKLSQISGTPIESINETLKKYSNYSFESIPVKEGIDHETAVKLYVQNAELPGVNIESGMKRQYIHGLESTSTALTLSHLLGYIGKLNEVELQEFKDVNYLPSDNIGKTGLEKFYENSLRGQYGKKKIEVDAFGKEQNILSEEPPLPGDNLYLTLDMKAQEKLETIVKNNLTNKNFKKGVAIAMNPETGGIVAMVSWPTFDNNDFSGGISKEQYQQYLKNADQPLFNRAISGNYPSGSTIKPTIVAAALQEGIITKNTTVNSVGGIQVGNWFFKDWKSGGHGITNATKAIAWSVNTFFYYIGGGYKTFNGLGWELLLKYFRLFNLGELTGIDLPGENSGFLPTREWKEKTKNEEFDFYSI